MEGLLRCLPDFNRRKVADRKSSSRCHHQSISILSDIIVVSFPVKPPPVPVTKAIRIEQGFDDFKPFKIANAGLGAVGRSQIHLPLQKKKKKSDKTRNTVVCLRAKAGCPSRASAIYSVVKECVTVDVVEEETQNCMGIGPRGGKEFKFSRRAAKKKSENKKKKIKKKKRTGSRR